MQEIDNSNAPRSLADLGEYLFWQEQIADKVMSGQKLTLEERQLIYERLTGKKAPSRKIGPKGQRGRDMKLAAYYLAMKHAGIKSAKEIRSELGKSCKLQGHENVDERTYFAALNRGINHLYKYAKDWLEFVEKDSRNEWRMQPLKFTEDAKQHLDLIEKYCTRNCDKFILKRG